MPCWCCAAHLERWRAVHVEEGLEKLVVVGRAEASCVASRGGGWGGGRGGSTGQVCVLEGGGRQG